MTDAERAEMIRQNPDYGVIVCRCEEISRGEILDALRSQICVPTLTFVIKIENTAEGFAVHTVSRSGVSVDTAKALVLATGCRERTAKQVFIHGTRPAGVFTAGTAQHFTNLLGEMPAKKCGILGSGDIGLIMARRLTLEGAEVVAPYDGCGASCARFKTATAARAAPEAPR